MPSKRRAKSQPSADLELLLRVAQEMPARVWIKDDRGRYVYVNPEVTRILGVERERFIGFTDEEIFPRVGHVYWRKDQIVLSTGKPLVTTDQVEENRFLFCLRFPLVIDGKPHVATLGVDTTSQMSALVGFVRLREESFRNERMRSIGEMASGLVHDLGNSLNISSMRLRLLKTKAGPELMADIETIERSLDAATSRVQDVREYVTSRRRENLVTTDLEELLSAAISMVDFLIERTPTERGGLIKIVRRSVGDLPPVAVFPNQLKHVIANLLLNARDAMPDGGELTIETHRTPSFAEIRVADEGSGVPDDILGKIFEPFFTTKATGNGLGLSMAQDVLSRMRGSIAVANRVPRGAEFLLSIPLG
ncbi:MAG TPA: ATP-binding protein [Candidatus Binataceae bacterium]|nr:ATP-binding protein [Candidatus Binataceae bacterium]